MRKPGDNKQSSDMIRPLRIQSTIKVWCLLVKDGKIGIYIIYYTYTYISMGYLLGILPIRALIKHTSARLVTFSSPTVAKLDLYG